MCCVKRAKAVSKKRSHLLFRHINNVNLYKQIQTARLEEDYGYDYGPHQLIAT